MKAISRNEKYLSKLSGEEEVVPKPISREERYMYRACGYVDRPIPEHAISREEKYWKKIIENGGGGSAVLTSKDITENGLYYAADDEADGYSSVNVDVPNTYLLSDEGKVVSNGTLVSQTSSTAGQNGIVDTTLINSLNVNVPDTNTTSGILPYVIHTSETALRSWTIYGNNTAHNYSADQTLPLTFNTNTAGAASDWSISGNDNVGKNKIRETWRQTTDPKLIISTTTVDAPLNSSWTISPNDDTIKIRLYGLNQEGKENIEAGLPSGQGNSFNIFSGTFFTEPKTWTNDNQNIVAFCVQLGNIDGTILSPQTVGTDVVMVRPADTSADFEPYQVGVGQRTVNLYNRNATDTNNGYVKPGRLRSDGTINEGTVGSNPWVTEYIPVDHDTTYTLTDLIQTSAYGLCYYDSNKDYISGSVYNVANHGNKTVTTPNTCKYIRFTVVEDFNSMLVAGSTAPETFIPYGYEIPLSVNNTPQTFYIGDTPLTAGQSISKTSTGVDITAVQGANTITTDLYNKPEMSIEGVDYVGVGERSGNDWQIPLTVSDGTSTTSVNVPIDAPLTEGESITDTQTISTFTGENTIGTTMTNKPNMDTVYIDEYNNLINKTITQNGTYSAADDSASGYSKVTVNVPAPPAPMLITKTITASGIYTAASDNADGYSEVTVNIRPYSEVLDQGLQAVVQEEE